LFREYKHWTHEGGISTPLIAHWPRGIPARQRNKLAHSPGHLIDLMATAIDVSGAKYPSEFNSRKIHPMEGVSLRPALTGKALSRPQPIFWEHEGNRAVRDGQWKPVAKENQAWELYDIAADRREMNDLAAKHPDKVKELSTKWDAWAARAGVLPLGAWRAKAQ
jgi:arylsulfatase